MKTLYKRFSVFTLIALTLFISSCGDDEPMIDPAADLYGEWRSELIDVEFTINDISLGTYLLNELGWTEEQIEDEFSELVDALIINLTGEINFMEDRTYVAAFGLGGLVTGNFIVEETEDERILTLTSDGTDPVSTEMIIVSTSETQLVVRFDQFFEGDLDNDGTVDVIVADVLLTMGRSE